MNQQGIIFIFFEPRHIEMYQTDWMPEKVGYKPATIARKSIVIRSFTFVT
ncbi:hypothetical protein ACFQDF_33075 [Ectobacillus funiculus]